VSADIPGDAAGDTSNGSPTALAPVDHLGHRRLGNAESWWWYGVAFVSYVVLGVWHKWLLNWFVGPAWVLATVWFGPMLFDLVRGRGVRASADPEDAAT
jgi:hypothetical protein